MWEFTLVKLEVIGVPAPKTSTGTANIFATKAKRQEHRAENPFFRVLAKKIVGVVPVKSEGDKRDILFL